MPTDFQRTTDILDYLGVMHSMVSRMTHHWLVPQIFVMGVGSFATAVMVYLIWAILDYGQVVYYTIMTVCVCTFPVVWCLYWTAQVNGTLQRLRNELYCPRSDDPLALTLEERSHLMELAQLRGAPYPICGITIDPSFVAKYGGVVASMLVASLIKRFSP